MIRLNRKKNRIRLSLKAIPMGPDLCVLITGGEAHIGAVTSGSKTKEPETSRFDTHKEYHITEMADALLRQEFDGNFTVCCGIHLDNIEKQEIRDVMDLSEQMLRDLCSRLKARAG